MRILVHDYSGHPFQVQLSRELARRGHEVLHLHWPGYVTGKGSLERRPDDPAGFAVEAIRFDEPFHKYSALRRPLQELAYARPLVAAVRAHAPDVVVSSNTPLFAQRSFLAACRRASLAFVFWQQDIYSVAMKRILERRIPLVGGVIGNFFLR